LFAVVGYCPPNGDVAEPVHDGSPQLVPFIFGVSTPPMQSLHASATHAGDPPVPAEPVLPPFAPALPVVPALPAAPSPASGDIASSTSPQPIAPTMIPINIP